MTPNGAQLPEIKQVREMIAPMLGLPPDQVGPETSLVSLDNSLGASRLKFGLKRLGFSVAFLSGSFQPTTFGELQMLLYGKQESPPVDTPTGDPDWVSISARSLQIGLDAQDVRALPLASDYWEHEFYAGVFGKPEIAYAVAQSAPRTHLAGFWAAKEALRKCDPAFLKVEMASVIVLHDSDGKPHLSRQTASGSVRLPHLLSLSHTGDLAIAVVVKPGLSASPPLVPDGAMTPVAIAPPKSRIVSLPLFLAILAGFIYLLVERLRRT